MTDVKGKVQMLRRFYSPQRYSSNPLEHKRLHRLVVEGRDKEFLPLIGFGDQTAWVKKCNGVGNSFTEAEYRHLARFFHLHDIADDGEEGWKLLTDRYPLEYFAIRLVQKGYGTLREFGRSDNVPMSTTTLDFLRPLLSFPARDIEIDIVEVAAERGAAELDELNEMGLLRVVAPWAAYAYQLTAARDAYGHLLVLEISSSIGGGDATCTIVAPSSLHAASIYSKSMRVPQPSPASQYTSFRMSDRHPRCTTVVLVTPQPLQGLPTPKPGKFFAMLPAQDVHLVASQLAEAEMPIFRGICTIGLRS